MSDLKWYVLKAISGQENKVKNYIENEMRRFGFEEFVTQVVIPMEKVIQVKNGKKSIKESVMRDNTALRRDCIALQGKTHMVK